MSKEEFLHLQHSESVVAQMAATVFAGLIQKQELTPENEDALVERSIVIATKLALRAEQTIKSDEEWLKKTTGSAYLLG